MSGTALKTFVETFYKEVQPERSKFTADDDSKARAQVYLHMLKKWLPDDYHCKVLHGHRTEFDITKL